MKTGKETTDTGCQWRPARMGNRCSGQQREEDMAKKVLMASVDNPNP